MGSFAGDDRLRALPLLKDARKLYTELVPQCVDVPLLAQEAMLGRATAEETLAGIVESAEATETSTAETSEPSKEEKRAGSLEQAREYYLELANKYPDSIAGKTAQERAKELESSRTKIEHFYEEANKKAAPKVNVPIPKVSP
jgi:hypothetical protein